MNNDQHSIDDLTKLITEIDGQKHIRSSDLLKLLRQKRNLNMLVESARSIMAEMGLDTLLTLIMESVTGVMNADRSTLFIVDRENDEIWSRIVQGTSEIRIKMGVGIVGYVAQTGDILNIPDAYEDDRFNRESDMKTGYRTKSILCMPMKNPEGEIVGTIEVLNKLDGKEFTIEDIELLGAFSSLAGISLSNAKAYEELAEERNLLDERVKERTKDLELSRKKSDELLLNILPAQIAEELKTQGRAVPRHYDLVSVMFTDFKGFTGVAEELDPIDLISELDSCFVYFDDVVERFNLEKIKTIGDSYMCAGGIPVPNETNPIESILAGMEILNFMKKKREEKSQRGEPFWEIRIGIHSGPVIAGVVGKRKFAYDIWGDAVNMASRLETADEVWKINISAQTYGLVRDYFECSYRGKIPVKYKGETDMYFVDRILPEFSLDSEGTQPNEKLMAQLSHYEK